MRLVLRLGALIGGAMLGGVVARLLVSDLTLVGMVAGAMLGWLVTGDAVVRRLHKAGRS